MTISSLFSESLLSIGIGHFDHGDEEAVMAIEGIHGGFFYRVATGRLLVFLGREQGPCVASYPLPTFDDERSNHQFARLRIDEDMEALHQQALGPMCSMVGLSRG